MDLARTLILLAKKGGSDLCKFQLYNHNILYKDHPEIPDVALSFDQSKMLFDYGASVDMEVFFSVFDVEKVKWCEEIGVKRYKLACGKINDWELLKAIAKLCKPCVISTDKDLFGWYDVKDFRFIYCSPKYPSTAHDYRYMLDKVDGISDHTIGLDCAKIALARGAEIIEKHFCLDHHTGIDAEWAMDFNELVELKRWETLCKEIL